MKTFFDGIFIDNEKLQEAGIEYPIKLEYFKTSKEENANSRFGIEVVKTEYLKDNIRVETKNVNDVTSNKDEINKILILLRNNEVTPVGVEDVLQDLVCK